MNDAQRNSFSVCGLREEGSLSMTTTGVKAEIHYGARGKWSAYFTVAATAAKEPLNSMKAQTTTPVTDT